MLTQGQKDEAKRMFNLLDSDGSGVLTKADFEKKLQEVAAIRNQKPGSPRYETLKSAYMVSWETIKQEADTNDDGQVTLDEFTSALDKTLNDKAKLENVIKKSHQAHFEILDADGSGNVSFEEFKQVQQVYGLNESTATKMFDELDSNGKGGISLEEYMQQVDWIFDRLK